MKGVSRFGTMLFDWSEDLHIPNLCHTPRGIIFPIFLAELIDKVPEWLGKTNDFFISKLPLFEKLPIDIPSLILPTVFPAS